MRMLALWYDLGQYCSRNDKGSKVITYSCGGLIPGLISDLSKTLEDTKQNLVLQYNILCAYCLNAYPFTRNNVSTPLHLILSKYYGPQKLWAAMMSHWLSLLTFVPEKLVDLTFCRRRRIWFIAQVHTFSSTHIPMCYIIRAQ